MTGMATERAMLPGAIDNGNVFEETEESIAVVSNTRAASGTEKGNPIIGKICDELDTTEGGQIAHTKQDVTIGLDTCGVADASVERRFFRGNRISSTLKQVARGACNMANSIFRDPRVTNVCAEFPEQQRAQHCCASAASFNGLDAILPMHRSGTRQSFKKRVRGGITWEKPHHGPLHVEPPTTGFHVQPLEYWNPRRGPVVGLRRAIRREERRMGRNLTAEEWQSVRDWCIQRNILKKMGLDYCFIEKRRSM
jgi:hypothetical protein